MSLEDEKEKQLSRPKGTYLCLYRGMVAYFDDEGVVSELAPEYVDQLKKFNTSAMSLVDPNLLAELMHWVIQDTRTGDLSYVLSKWLTKNFEIKLKAR